MRGCIAKILMATTLLLLCNASWAQGQFVEENNDSFAAEPESESGPDSESESDPESESGPESEPDSSPEPSVPPENDAEPEPSAASGKKTKKNPRGVKDKNDKSENEKNDVKKQKNTDKKNEKGAPRNISATGAPAEGIVIRQLSLDGVIERWDAFRKADRAQESAKARRLETILNDGLRDFGIQGLQLRPQLLSLAKARTREAEDALVNQDIERALLAAEQATKLAPDKPQTHLFLARLKMAGNDSAGAITHFGAAIRALKRDPTSVVYGIFYADLVLLLGLMFFFTVFILFFLLRGFRYVAFDLHSVLPRGATKGQIYALLGIALVLPLTLRLGPVFLGLIWTTAVFLYLTKKEQIFVLLMGPLLIAAPFGIHALGVLGAYQGSRVELAYRALQDASAFEVRAELKKQNVEQLLLPELMPLGFEAKREGRLEEARDYWRQAVQRFSSKGSGHVNLGVAAALLGSDEFALSSFKKGLEKDAKRTEAGYNASLIHVRNKDVAKAAIFIEPLQANVPDLLEAYRSATFRSGNKDLPHNRAFVDGAYEMNVLEDLFQHPPEAAVHIERQLRANLFFGLENNVSAILIGIFVLVWLALLGTRKKFVPSAPCDRCGTPASSRYDVENCTSGICTGCFNIFDSTGVRIEASRRLAKEYQANAFRGRRRRAGLLLSLLWPGLGLLWVRASLRGGILALLYYPACILIAFGMGYILWPDLTPDIAATLSLGVGVGMAIFLQLIGLRLVISETE
ncbi:MAG: hypothetical protein GY822_01440 [Deltaproteobacteria bacterium]|nr:hypothetical protein [Deltaproteobacteria bacterium]